MEEQLVYRGSHPDSGTFISAPSFSQLQGLPFRIQILGISDGIHISSGTEVSSSHTDMARFFPLSPKACQLLLLFTYMEEGLSSEKEGSGRSLLLFWAGRSIG